MIAEAEEAMDEQKTRFEMLDGQLKRLMERSGLNQCAWTVILVCILAFLIFLIIYT